MIKTILLLVALTAVQGDLIQVGNSVGRLTLPHPDCPFGIHHLLPHEYDCTKFYYCQWGERFIVPTSCAPGTEFSPILQVCTHPWFSDCDLPGSPTTEGTDPSTSSTTTTSTTTTPTTTTTTPTTTTPTTTTPTTTTPTTTTPTTTTSTTTTPTTTATPTTTTPTTTTPTTTTPTTTTPTTTTPTTTTFSSTTPEDDGYLDNGCPANFDIRKRLPHETSCRKYYLCDHGEKILRTCDDGLIFNPAIEDCDDPANTDRTCEDSSEDEDPEDPEDDEEDLLPNGCPPFVDISITLPHEFYCSKSYQCVFGQKTKGLCPAGTDFDYFVKVAVSAKKSLKKKFVKILICVTC